MEVVKLSKNDVDLKIIYSIRIEKHDDPAIIRALRKNIKRMNVLETEFGLFESRDQAEKEIARITGLLEPILDRAKRWLKEITGDGFYSLCKSDREAIIEGRMVPYLNEVERHYFDVLKRNNVIGIIKGYK